MRIRNRQSVITTGAEGVPPKKIAPSITRLLYFGALIGIFLYLLYTLGMRHFTYTGNGYIEMDTLTISSPQAGEIIQLPVSVGEQVETGQLIAVIAASKRCQKTIDKRGENLEFDISLNRAKLKSLREELAYKSQQVEDKIIRRALEIDKEFNRTRTLAKREVEELKLRIARLTREIEAQKSNYYRHKARLTTPQDNADCQDKKIVSPISGRVRQLHINLHETTARNGAIVTLVRNDAQVYINATFDKELLGQLTTNPTLEITLPDGTISQGKVVSTRTVSRELKIPGAKEGDIVARIIPTTDPAGWRKFEQLHVSVKGSTR